MINNSLKNKKLIICYEDRNDFKKKYKKVYGKNISESWSKFLIDKESIENIIKFLEDKIEVKVLTLDDINGLKQLISKEDLSNMVLWNISDGCDIYKGSYIPSFARLLNIKFYGSETYTQYIAQDKFKFISICDKLNISTPKSILYSYEIKNFFPELPSNIFTNEEVLFVKPNSFDNNIGIRCNAKTDLQYLKCNVKEICKTLQSDVLIQNYIFGYDLRVCYIGKRDIEKDKIGILKVEKFIPIEGNKSIEFINETEADEVDCKVSKYENIELSEKIKEDIIKISKFLKLKDYFAFDIRVSQDNKNYFFLELNTAPFVINKLMESYAQLYYGKTIQEVFYDSIITCFATDT